MIIPYTSQRMIPTSSISIMGRERSFVCFVFSERIACGKRANVVKKAATKPSMVIIVWSKLIIQSEVYESMDDSKKEITRCNNITSGYKSYNIILSSK